MPSPVIIGTSTTINGPVQADSFDLGPGATVKTTSGLAVKCTGDIFIHGTIRGADQSGASIRLESTNGSVFVFGSVIAGSGEDHLDQAPLPNPVGRAGGNGGSVDILAPSNAVTVTGTVRAGKGGTGQDAVASEGGEVRTATSGAGGHGGSVNISAGFHIRITGDIKAGDGGDGGRAQASFWTFEDWQEAFQATGPAFYDPEMLDPTGAAPQNPRSAHADAGPGGAGGKVGLVCGARGLGVVLTGPVVAGNGGNTSRAEATFAETAEATAQAAREGGDVTIDLGLAGTLIVSGPAPKPGDGGHCGETKDTRRATAGARNQATARVVSGGAGGTYRAGIVRSRGRGGNAGSARAKTSACDRSDLGNAASGPYAGLGGQASCP
jgi:hypothetical protein